MKLVNIVHGCGGPSKRSSAFNAAKAVTIEDFKDENTMSFQYFQNVIDDVKNFLFVGLDSDSRAVAILAFCLVGRERDNLSIKLLWTKASWRAKGCSTCLIEQALQFLVDHCHLQSGPDVPITSRGLFRKLEFLLVTGTQYASTAKKLREKFMQGHFSSPNGVVIIDLANIDDNEPYPQHTTTNASATKPTREASRNFRPDEVKSEELGAKNEHVDQKGKRKGASIKDERITKFGRKTKEPEFFRDFDGPRGLDQPNDQAASKQTLERVIGNRAWGMMKRSLGWGFKHHRLDFDDIVITFPVANKDQMETNVTVFESLSDLGSQILLYHEDDDIIDEDDPAVLCKTVHLNALKRVGRAPNEEEKEALELSGEDLMPFKMHGLSSGQTKRETDAGNKLSSRSPTTHAAKLPSSLPRAPDLDTDHTFVEAPSLHPPKSTYKAQRTDANFAKSLKAVAMKLARNASPRRMQAYKDFVSDICSKKSEAWDNIDAVVASFDGQWTHTRVVEETIEFFYS